MPTKWRQYAAVSGVRLSGIIKDVGARPRAAVSDAMPDKPVSKTLYRELPITRGFNHLVAGSYFERIFGRWPLPPAHADALINDVIFARMIDEHWTPTQIAFVDKEHAKAAARRLAPALRVPETLCVFPTDNIVSPEQLFSALAPFAGSKAIAKPTHASGAVVFLEDLTAPADLRYLLALATNDYVAVIREMQYRGLPKKIIVEQLIPSASRALDDYKFHCVNGEPLVCQVDHHRFGQGWSQLFSVPDFNPMDAHDGLAAPESYQPPEQDRVHIMMSSARALAAPFDFVRVDLYNGLDGVYFGELTFTPGGSLGIAPSIEGQIPDSATHRRYSRIIMDALRQS
jgi:hypothetical protein